MHKNNLKPSQQQSTYFEPVSAIDQILNHHYFHSKLSEIISQKCPQTSSSDFYSLMDNQYFKAQSDLVDNITQILHESIERKLREVLQKQFIDVQQQIQAMRVQMYQVQKEQQKKLQQFSKDLCKMNEQIKRKLTTGQVMSNYTGTGNTGIRFHRSGATGMQSSIQSINSMNSTNGVNGSTNNSNFGETKSYFSELSSLRKQIESLKESVQNGEMLKRQQQQFSQFKVQTKIALETLKQNLKKATVELSSISNSSSSNTISKPLKQSIQSSVKRTVSSQLKVYASYSDELSQIKQGFQLLNDKIDKQGQNYLEYLSNQLKSVWLIINDIKKVQDSITDQIGLRQSRILL